MESDWEMIMLSLFNDVLGPIMRGPSSSHTAGPYFIGSLARHLLGEEPVSVCIQFDPEGSFAEVYRQQGSDLGFTAGFMGLSITSPHFPEVLKLAGEKGLQIEFIVAPIQGADHPNTSEIRMTGRRGEKLNITAKSVGGGAIILSRLNGWAVHLTGKAHDVLVLSARDTARPVKELLRKDRDTIGVPHIQTAENRAMIQVHRRRPLNSEVLSYIAGMKGVHRVWTAPPLFFIPVGKPLFSSASELIALAGQKGCSMGSLALLYESQMIELSEEGVISECMRRFEVMKASMERGLKERSIQMRLLQPSALALYRAETQGRLAIGGIHARAAARAMAVMHANSVHDVVCAAPTAGSAGVIPGVLLTLVKEKNLNPRQIALSLLAASAVGLVVAGRATFAAEVAGCQAEIGAAGAMASAAVVESVGGNAEQACNAAAIFIQNTMGSICDSVQGLVEIPCHTRNAVAASSAFVCADLILGGYQNPIPLDETVDAMYAVGKMLPRELKCTARGGLSQTPSALKL
ncbi:MAG: L-serine ammonia-lyase, iron-sulfur-dependent, subunit alpha [Pseudomonadota bacterium]